MDDHCDQAEWADQYHGDLGEWADQYLARFPDPLASTSKSGSGNLANQYHGDLGKWADQGDWADQGGKDE